MPREIVDYFADVRCDKKLVMVRAVLLCSQPGVVQLVVAVLAKADGKCFDRLAHRLRHQSHYRARIDSARKKRSQRNIGNQPRLDRVFQQEAQLLDIRFLTARSFRFKVEIPILLSGYLALFVSKRITGRQLFNIAEDTQRVGNVT